MCFGNVCLWADRSKAWGNTQNPIPVLLSNNFQLYGNPEYSEWVENITRASKDYLSVLSKNWYGWSVHSVTTGVGFGTHRLFTYWWAWWQRVRMHTCHMKTLFVWECEGETTWCKEKNHTDILLRWRAPGDILFSFSSFFSLSPAPSWDRPVIETPGGPAVSLLLCDTIANPDLASVASLEQHRDVECANLDFKVSWHIWFPHSLLLRY